MNNSLKRKDELSICTKFNEMSSARAHPGVIPIAQAINRYFELSVYLLVLTGFGTLASTGALELPAIMLVGAALAFRGYLLAQNRRLLFSQRWTTPLSMAYFAVYAADYSLFSRSFLGATVHLVLFAVVVRMFSLRRDRDYVMLCIVSFLMVLASSVLTVDSIFLLFFAAFMLMAIVTFVLLEMRRAGREATFQAQPSANALEHRKLAFSVARVTPILAVLILLGAAAIFFLLPRISSGYMSDYSLGTNFSTGFSDRVRLGGIGQIQQSNAVVMHIQIAGDTHGAYALHWRGVSLANFDGRDWSNPPGDSPLEKGGDGTFTVPEFSQGIVPNPSVYGAHFHDSSRMIHYRVVMEPVGTNVFFLAPWARTVNGGYRGLQIDWGGGISNSDTQHGVSIYEADSDIYSPSPDLLRKAGNSFPSLAYGYLQHPPLDPRIPQLAAQIAGGQINNYDRAVAIEKYLKTHYGYTLQLLRTPVADPLANFLFVRKQGHCEYFASSMAIMLRTLRIPSRVVNGFRSSEFNDVTGKYVVRARDAHAWVEAFFPGYGWITFDPTPGGFVGSPQGLERAMLYIDAAASFWREWVVSYDSTHQYVLGRSVLMGTRRGLDRSRFDGQRVYLRLLNWARRLERHGIAPSGRWIGVAVAIAIILMAALNARRVYHILRFRSIRMHPECSPQQAAAICYQRMTRSLARRGVQKQPSQTAQEFVRVIEDERLQRPVARFTEVYESARFGNSTEDAQKMPELLDEVEAAARGADRSVR